MKKPLMTTIPSTDQRIRFTVHSLDDTSRHVITFNRNNVINMVFDPFLSNLVAVCGRKHCRVVDNDLLIVNEAKIKKVIGYLLEPSE